MTPAGTYWCGTTLRRGIKLNWIFDADFLTAEVLPILFADHKRAARRRTQSTLVSLVKRGSEPLQRLIADYRARASEPGFRVRFGESEFDDAVRAAIADHTGDDAWPLLRDAL